MFFNEHGIYRSAMDHSYVDSASTNFLAGYEASLGTPDIGGPIEAVPKAQILTTGQIGQTLGEGRGSGTFLDSMKAAIYKGVTSVELSLSASGSEPNIGPDLYSQEKREELRSLARANQVNIVSVHTPVQIVANMSGYAGEQRGFLDEQRELQVNEVKKAIQFAGDTTTNGGAVVVHTGEFQRPFVEQPWAQNQYGEFKHYEEEPLKFVKYLVDERTGRIVGDARKNQVVFEPLYKTAGSEGLVGQRARDPVSGKEKVLDAEDWVDMRGNYIDPLTDTRLFERVPEWNQDFTRFKTKRMTWDDFVKRTQKWNKDHAPDIAQNPKIHRSPEEMFFITMRENEALQYRGSSLFHGRFYHHERDAMNKAIEALKTWEKIEQETPPEQRWRYFRDWSSRHAHELATYRLVPQEGKLPSEILKQFIEDQGHSLRYAHEASGSADARADTLLEDTKHMMSVEKYGKMKSTNSYAEVGIYAMDLTRDKKLTQPIFVAPENIFPEMGYASHPEEMTQLVLDGRKLMADRLVKERHMSQAEAEQKAAQHIKTTLDTEHLGMWKRYFQKKQGETDDHFNKRFNSWYLDQVKKMHEKGVIGHIHIADGFGYGHANLPAGQGTMPIVDAVRYLKTHGYKGAYLSEGYGDAPRMMRDTWKAFGSPIYSHTGPLGSSRWGSDVRWSDVQFSYFGRNVPPLYIFGSYSPSTEWKLWSEVPFE